MCYLTKATSHPFKIDSLAFCSATKRQKERREKLQTFKKAIDY